MSERELNTAFKNELSSQEFMAALLIFMDFPSGAVRLHTAIGTITYDGQTWQGTGGAIRVSEMPEATDGAAVGMTIEISGIDATHLSDVINDKYQGQDAEVTLLLFNSSNQIIEGQKMFKGTMDSGTVTLGADATAVCKMQLESALINQTRSIPLRYNSADQKRLYPGFTDKGFDAMPRIQDQTITWGPTS